MTHNTPDPNEAATRLRRALTQPNPLSCEQAAELLPALIEAELAGADVDAAPEFAELLQHIDQCADCAALYAEMSEDLALLADPAAPLPSARPPMPAPFRVARQGESLVLRVFSGLVRRFELALGAPQLGPAIATLSGEQSTPLFADALPEIAGSPLLSVSLQATGGTASLQIGLREAGASARWQVQVATPEAVYSARTDERGIARIEQIPLDALGQLTIHCAELPAEPAP